MRYKLLSFIFLIFCYGCQNSKFKADCEHTISEQQQIIIDKRIKIDTLEKKLKHAKENEQRLALSNHFIKEAKKNSKIEKKIRDSLEREIKLTKKQIDDNSVFDDLIKDELINENFKIVRSGIFYKDDVQDSLQNLNWFGLYKTDDDFHIKKTNLSVEPAVWGYIETSERDAKKNAATSIEAPILLISGLKNINEGIIESVDLRRSNIYPEQRSFIYPGQRSFLKLNDIKVSLYAFGTFLQKKSVKEYFLEMSALKKVPGQARPKRINQVIAGTKKKCGNALYSILWAGDIDQDGMLDLILEFDCSDAGSYKVELFLSSEAGENDLLKKVAEWENIVHRGC